MLGMTADRGPSPKQQYVVETAQTCSAVYTHGYIVVHSHVGHCCAHVSGATRIDRIDSESPVRLDTKHCDAAHLKYDPAACAFAGLYSAESWMQGAGRPVCWAGGGG